MLMIINNPKGTYEKQINVTCTNRHILVNYIPIYCLQAIHNTAVQPYRELDMNFWPIG